MILSNKELQVRLDRLGGANNGYSNKVIMLTEPTIEQSILKSGHSVNAVVTEARRGLEPWFILFVDAHRKKENEQLNKTRVNAFNKLVAC